MHRLCNKLVLSQDLLVEADSAFTSLGKSSHVTPDRVQGWEAVESRAQGERDKNPKVMSIYDMKLSKGGFFKSGTGKY